MTDVEKKRIKDWIDDQFELKRRLSSIQDYDGYLRSCEGTTPYSILLYKGIEKVAIALNQVIHIKEYGEKARLLVDYSGKEIVQIVEVDDVENILHRRCEE